MAANITEVDRPEHCQVVTGSAIHRGQAPEKAADFARSFGRSHPAMVAAHALVLRKPEQYRLAWPQGQWLTGPAGQGFTQTGVVSLPHQVGGRGRGQVG